MCIHMAAERVMPAGLNDLVVAGGMESMSNCPHYLPGNARANGLRMGHARLVDGMLHDGLWDPYSDTHMGECAEQCASERGITRERQDAHALRSVERARTAQTSGATARVGYCCLHSIMKGCILAGSRQKAESATIL